jgi:hypothetical protein
VVIKILALTFVAATVVRLLFRKRWEELGRWFSRAVDMTLVAIAIVLGAQLLLVALRG